MLGRDFDEMAYLSLIQIRLADVPNAGSERVWDGWLNIQGRSCATYDLS
jgi:hypothetical protein